MCSALLMLCILPVSAVAVPLASLATSPSPGDRLLRRPRLDRGVRVGDAVPEAFACTQEGPARRRRRCRRTRPAGSGPAALIRGSAVRHRTEHPASGAVRSRAKSIPRPLRQDHALAHMTLQRRSSRRHSSSERRRFGIRGDAETALGNRVPERHHKLKGRALNARPAASASCLDRRREAGARISISNGPRGGEAPRRQRRRFGGTGGLALSRVTVTRRFGAM